MLGNGSGDRKDGTLLAVVVDNLFREQLSTFFPIGLKKWIVMVGKQGSCKNCQAWHCRHDTKFVVHSNSQTWCHRPDTKLIDIVIANIKLIQINQRA